MDEVDAIHKIREFVAHLNWQLKTPLPRDHILGTFEEPLYSKGEISVHYMRLFHLLLEELLGVVPANIRIPFDMNEVICRIVDGSRFSDFKPLYGPNLITGWAHIQGFPVGIIANNNPIFPAEANKAVQFIQLCNMR